MILRLAAGAAFAVAAMMSMSAPSSAMTLQAGLHAPQSVENVACRVVRRRVVHPNGRVVWRNEQHCAPGVVVAPIVVAPRVVKPRCAVVRERVVRPSGVVVVRSVRRCN